MNNASKKSNVKVLVRLMTRTGDAFLDLRLEKYGYRGTQHIFCTVNFDDTMKVEDELVEI